MSKTILLTGGTGFLGSYLGYEFLKRGDRVIYLAREQRGRNAVERVETLLNAIDPDFLKAGNSSYEIWSGDVTQQDIGQNDETITKWKNKIDEVWHCAAVLHFRDTYETLTESININGTVNMLNVTNKLGVKRYHHVSTAYVSGKAPGKVFEDEGTHDYDFRNPYERTKYDAEQEVKKKSEQYGFDTTIYRPSVIIGSSTTGKTLSFTGFYNIAKIFNIIKKLMLRSIKQNPDKMKKAGIYLKDEKLVLPLRFPCRRGGTVNLVPIDYVLNTIIKLSDTPKSIGQVYHITHPHPPEVAELMCFGTRLMNLEGINFEECPYNSALDLMREEVQKYASFGLNISFCLEIREYIHYFYGEPYFDMSNVYDTLGDSYIEPPIVTNDVMKKIISFAVERQWKSMIP